MNKLYKSRTDRKLLGVCGGIANFFGLDATIIRLVWVVSVVFLGTGVWLYIIGAFVIPEEPYDDGFIDHDSYK